MNSQVTVQENACGVRDCLESIEDAFSYEVMDVIYENDDDYLLTAEDVSEDDAIMIADCWCDILRLSDAEVSELIAGLDWMQIEFMIAGSGLATDFLQECITAIPMGCTIRGLEGHDFEKSNDRLRQQILRVQEVLKLMQVRLESL